MLAIATSISALLRDRAQQRPDARAYTLSDYDAGPAGESRSLTWSQVHQRAQSERFAPFNLPSYGLAEAVVCVASSTGRPWTVARFDYEKLSAGHAQRRGREQAGSELVSHGAPGACTMRIVDPETRVENPAGMLGEI
jgi:acyl-CoA synthetase (AMP-forming)/AMP-acid ligase II